MGLFDFFKRFKKSEREVRVLILGLDNAGKTTILRRMCGEDTSMIQPTQGFNAKSVAASGARIMCYDVGGQKAIRSYWQNYFQGTSGFIWVVDSADAKRMEEVALELSLCTEDSRLANVPVLIFANKQDMATAIKPSDIGDKLGLHAIRDHPWNIQGCSALTGQGLDEGLQWLVEKTNQ